MAGHSHLRGKRAGSGPSGGPERGVSEPRTTISFWCARHHHTTRSFAATAVAPLTWDCPHCGLTSGRDESDPPAAIRLLAGKSHLTHVRERRDDKAGEAILEEALAKLRAKRGVTGKAVVPEH
jgi:hypothetical protein